jgi:O-antigen/teichoic acid export membrane protein
MIKNTFFMTLSTLVRLLTGVVLFIVLARLLGPEDFGRLMYGFTLASIADG